MNLNAGALQQLMREIRKTVLDDIAEAMRVAGFIGGNKLNGGQIVGSVPVGSAKIIVQKDGVQVGTPTYVLNFQGVGFIVTPDTANNRINIGLAFANGPSNIIDDSLVDVTDDAGNVLYAGA